MKKNSSAIRLKSPRSKPRDHSAPISMTSSFVFPDAEHGRALFAEEIEGDIYSRYSNPNTTELVTKMAALEETDDGLAFSSGMAAIFAGLAGLLNSGDHLVASRSLFGATHQILTTQLPRWGISCTFVDANNLETWEDAVQPNTRMVYVETPSNPGLDIIDLQWLGEFKSRRSLLLFVDNSFATPVLQNPAHFGADLIAHSTTKFIDGQGRTLGGVLVGKEAVIARIRPFFRQTGPSMSPFTAWLLNKSLETLALRMEKHCSNALTLAQTLQSSPELLYVRYPLLPSFPQIETAKRQMRWGGGLFTMTVKGGYSRACAFMNALKLVSLTANLGDTRTIVTHPASTTHSKLTEEERLVVGITPGLLRISVGLEDVEDILADLQNALNDSKC